MQPGKVFDDGQAEARAADLARAGTVGPVKPFKDALQMLGQNAFAGVGYRDQSRPPTDSNRTVTVAAAAIKLDRVVDEICQASVRAAQHRRNTSVGPARC